MGLGRNGLKRFEKLGLQWYGLPAVSGMLMEMGGIQFPACPFSGWYALSEIATRDLLDPHRYNLLYVSKIIHIEFTSKSSLGKDDLSVRLRGLLCGAINVCLGYLDIDLDIEFDYEKVLESKKCHMIM